MQITRYRITSSRLPEGAHFRLAVVSDLHNKIYRPDQQGLLEPILAEAPDMVLCPGDLFDHRNLMPGAELLLRGLQGRISCCVVPGNHEYSCKDSETLFRQAQSWGATVLRNSCRTVRLGRADLLLVGLDEAIRKKERPKYQYGAALTKLSQRIEGFSGYRILLAHHPEHIGVYEQYPFDLILSGHAHGGQWRLPGLINGVYAPGQGLFPRYAGGLYPRERAAFIVSRGLSNMTWIPRIMNPPELVILDVCREEGGEDPWNHS